MLLEVKSLSKSFKKKKAVNDISFTLDRGQIAILCGPNGAGKTTTLKCILSLLRKDSGEVLIDGVSSREPGARQKLAYIPEVPDLYPLLTVWEHFKFVALAYKIENWEETAREYLNLFNLSGEADSLCKELSKGMKQKVSIIMGLIHDPEILLIDEPFIGLDPRGIKDFKEIMGGVRDLGKSLVVSTHILASMEQLSNVMIIMKEGNLIEYGSKEYLREKYGEEGSIEDLFFKITDQDKEEVKEI